MMDSFNIHEYFKFDEFDPSPEQTVSEPASQQIQFSQARSSSLYLQAEMHPQNVFDGRYQLPEMPPYNPYIPSILVDFPSQPGNIRQYDFGGVSQHQEHCQLSDKQEPPLYGQAIGDSYNPIEMPPFDSSTMNPTSRQQDFQSELSALRDAVSAEPACADLQPMVRVFFFLG